MIAKCKRLVLPLIKRYTIVAPQQPKRAHDHCGKCMQHAWRNACPHAAWAEVIPEKQQQHLPHWLVALPSVQQHRGCCAGTNVWTCGCRAAAACRLWLALRNRAMGVVACLYLTPCLTVSHRHDEANHGGGVRFWSLAGGVTCVSGKTVFVVPRTRLTLMKHVTARQGLREGSSGCSQPLGRCV